MDVLYAKNVQHILLKVTHQLLERQRIADREERDKVPGKQNCLFFHALGLRGLNCIIRALDVSVCHQCIGSAVTDGI